MFKPELWQNHNEYRTLVTQVGRRLSRNNSKYPFDSYREEREKLLNLNPDLMLPNSISLTVLIGCASTEELPPLGSYYGFMDCFWLGSRDTYSRSSLLPADKNGKKPKKIIGTDGKLQEPEDPCTATTRDILDSITSGKPASDNPEATLQIIFSILAVFLSV